MDHSARKKIDKPLNQRALPRLFAYVLPSRRLFAGAIACVATVSLLRVIQPKFMQHAVDGYIAHRDINGLKWLAIILLGIRLVGLLLVYLEGLLLAHVGKRVVTTIRAQLFEKLQRLEVAFFDRTPIGSIMTQMTSDLEVINEACTTVAVGCIGDLLVILTIASFMFWMDWQLTLLVLLSVPIILVLTGRFRHRSQSAWETVRSKLSIFHSVVQEHLAGALTIQKFNREAKSLQKFKEVSAAHHDACVKAHSHHARFLSYVDLVYAFALTMVIGFGGWRATHVVHGRPTFTLGMMIAFIQYSQMLFQPVRELYDRFNTLQSARAAARRIFRTLDRPLAARSSNHKPKRGGLIGRIEFQNVWFAYDDEDWVLKDVSFTIEPGQVVALVGRTGAGKTTIANLIMRFYDVSRGRVLIDGVDVRDWDLTTFRNSVAFVPQDGFLFSTTIEENIRLGRALVTHERCLKAVQEVCANEFIEKLPQGYETEVLERGDNFSAGQKQLISLARSLASDPSLLILDEATSAVDVETEKRIQRTLERVMQERTAVVIAHRLSTIHGADRIIVLHQGEIREQGSHEELITADGIYSRLYGLQFPVASFMETRRAT